MGIGGLNAIEGEERMTATEIALPPFQSFEKIARLNRECVISEKIDGTNALIHIADDCETMRFGSRNKWITPEADHFGFARWGENNRAELLRLGAGYHYGEWWGAGIGRRYGLQDKRFSLFNLSVWSDDAIRPACCGVVPELARGIFSSELVSTQIERLRAGGSVAAPGFPRPEGAVIYHTHSRTLFKVTLEGDEQPKGRDGSPIEGA